MPITTASCPYICPYICPTNPYNPLLVQVSEVSATPPADSGPCCHKMTTPTAATPTPPGGWGGHVLRGRMSTLFSDYFGYVRGAPPGLTRVARSHIQLLDMVAPVPGASKPHSLGTRPYWLRYVKVDPMLRAWLKTPEAFRPPERWFDGCVLQGIITPHEFARDLMPRSPRKDVLGYGTKSYRTWTFDIEDLPILAAYCHGWPLTVPETRRAQYAAELLHEVPQFLVYSQFSLDHIPMPFSERSYQVRMSSRHRLEFDPLALTASSMKLAVPDWALTADGVRTHGLPRAEVVGSTKIPYFLDANRQWVNT